MFVELLYDYRHGGSFSVIRILHERKGKTGKVREKKGEEYHDKSNYCQ
ncbi:hypothetical protein QS257_01740 [Terrilactibacillus sp. S3-3]|nr:hypothetical protein QS257_01740 [Terrilactibacillus sp. S3-3]